MATHETHGQHDHNHAHDHAPLPDRDGAWSDAQYLEAAVRELLLEKGILTADEIRRQIEAMDRRSPEQGARVVARAWVDPGYRQRLLQDGTAAVRELGIEIEPVHLIVVENTEREHNLVVCTLCSCYPRNLLGLPPDWYKARAYRSRAVSEPRTVLAEFGTAIPDHVAVRVHDSTADMRYMVLPRRPSGTEGMGEAELAALISRDSMIGVVTLAPPKP
ncbi:MAG: nitrile hydratase subunit alpha [Alphaproteobacteria bacterium]|nr:nitrile hydratase subunit alpha [Alphaproteobacteria bacterium]